MKRLLLFLVLCLACRAEMVRCEGWSMVPTWPFSSVRYLDRFYPYGRLQPGMIVMRMGVIGVEGNVSHRLVRYYPGKGWETKGDGNKRCDEGLMSEQTYVGLIR